MMILIVFNLLPAPSRRPADKIGAGLEIHRRNADPGKVILIGAVKVTAVGKLIGFNHTSLFGGIGINNLVNG